MRPQRTPTYLGKGLGQDNGNTLGDKVTGGKGIGVNGSSGESLVSHIYERKVALELEK